METPERPQFNSGCLRGVLLRVKLASDVPKEGKRVADLFLSEDKEPLAGMENSFEIQSNQL